MGIYIFYSRRASYIGHKLHDRLIFASESDEMQRERAHMLLRRKYKRYSKHKMTYLGLIAYVIQNAPEKKLKFYEVRSRLLQRTQCEIDRLRILIGRVEISHCAPAFSGVS